MKIFVVVSFMRAIRGARYEVQAVFEDPDVAARAIKEAAIADDVELELVERRCWKGGGVLVTIHELEFGGTIKVSEPHFVLGEDRFPIGTEVRSAPVDPEQVAELKRVLKPTAIRERHAQACLMLRDCLDEHSDAGKVARAALDILDPDKVYDDGD